MMRYLIIRLSSLGDVVLALGAVSAIKRHDPSAKVGFATKAAYRDVVALCSDVDQCIECDDPKRMTQALIEFKADVAIDLHGVPKSWSVARCSLAPTVVGVKKRRWMRQRLVWASRWKRWTTSNVQVGETHLHLAGSQKVWRVTDAYVEALNRAGIPSGTVTTVCHPRPEDVKKCKLELQKRGKGRAVLGVVPGARWAIKRWPQAHYFELIKMVKSGLSVQVVLLGDRSDEQEAGLLTAEPDAINVMGRASLSEMAAWLSCCDLVVGGDTGPMHLASAVGTPVCVLFGPTDPQFGFLPKGPQDTVAMVDVSCRPCHLHGGHVCPIQTHSCLTELVPESLAPHVAGMLAKKGG